MERRLGQEPVLQVERSPPQPFRFSRSAINRKAQIDEWVPGCTKAGTDRVARTKYVRSYVKLLTYDIVL